MGLLWVRRRLDDNPYSRSQFKTLKHHPIFPDRFGSIEDARAEQIMTARLAVLHGAFAAHPERFVREPPTPPRQPEQVWINKPHGPREALSNLPADVSHRG